MLLEMHWMLILPDGYPVNLKAGYWISGWFKCCHLPDTKIRLFSVPTDYSITLFPLLCIFGRIFDLIDNLISGFQYPVSVPIRPNTLYKKKSQNPDSWTTFPGKIYRDGPSFLDKLFSGSFCVHLSGGPSSRHCKVGSTELFYSLKSYFIDLNFSLILTWIKDVSRSGTLA